MSLKTDYLNGSDGFTQKMQDASQAGSDWVVTNRNDIVTELMSSAAKGLKEFTITLDVAYEPNNLRLQGLHWRSFQSGIISALIVEEIHAYEVNVKLNTSDNVVTKIDLVFDFTGQV